MSDPTPSPGEGRWEELRRDVVFHVERFLARSTTSKVVALWGLLVLLSLVGGVLAWLTPALSFEGPRDATWWAFLRLSDPGYLDEAETPLVRILSIVLTVLGLALFVGGLIAIITQGFTKLMDRVALGLVQVRFRGHIAVLGWTDRTLGLIVDLVGQQPPPRVVVLAERITAEMEESLRERLPRKLRSRVVLRTGDPQRLTDLARIRGSAAEAVVLPSVDHQAGDPGTDDARVLKVIASLDRTTGQAGARPRVIAEIGDSSFIPVGRAAYRGPLQMIASELLVGRSFSLGVLSPGLTLALADLVDVRTGIALRVEPAATLGGSTVLEASARLPSAIILGTLRQSTGGVVLDSDSAVRLKSEDRMLLVAPATGAVEVLDTPLDVLPVESFPEDGGQAASPRRVLVLGWSGKVRELCHLLADPHRHPSEIHVISRTEPGLRESQLELPSSMSVRHLVGDTASPSTFEGLDLGSYDRVILAGSENTRDVLESDSRTITAALLLLDRLQGASTRPTVIAEILDTGNRAVLEGRGIELVVTSDLVARVLVGAVARPELAGVLERIVAGQLGRMEVLPLCQLVDVGETTSFGAIEPLFRSRGAVCLGIQRESQRFAPELVPDKRMPFSVAAEDRVLVVTPRIVDGAY